MRSHRQRSARAPVCGSGARALLVLTLLTLVLAASPAAAPARTLAAAGGGPSGILSRGHGFVRDAGGFARIDVPGGSFTAASRSNPSGQITGFYLDGRKQFHGFVRDGRRLRPVDFPGSKGTFPAGIDGGGRVVVDDGGRVLGYVVL